MTGLSSVPSPDFDFEFGSWIVHHRRLNRRLCNCTEWTVFSGRSSTRPILGGAGNLEDNELDLPEGLYRAVALRSYDSAKGQWAIWWLDGRMPFAPLDPPVKGHFINGVGVFYSDDTLRGKPVKVRFTWSNISPTTAHWEQAFSGDGGKTWETNWTTDFTRVAQTGS